MTIQPNNKQLSVADRILSCSLQDELKAFLDSELKPYFEQIETDPTAPPKVKLTDTTCDFMAEVSQIIYPE